MKNVYIYCEGQTEESFVREILYPYFFNIGIYVYPILCTTKRTDQKKFKGGITKYSRIKKELTFLSKSHPNELITTMIDYYRLPEDTPGITINDRDIYERIQKIEETINSDLDLKNCKFNLMLHEFEALLFSNPDSFNLITGAETVEQIKEIRNSFKTPEQINNSPETAPSKRILALIPNYAKIKNGTLLTKDMGIDLIINQCPHFREWIRYITERANEFST